MASEQEIRELRNAIGEPEDSPPYTDPELEIVIADTGSVRAAAAQIWRGKAASVAHLVNISEGGSSRSAGDLQKKFLDMAAQFETPTLVTEDGVARPRTRNITRA